MAKGRMNVGLTAATAGETDITPGEAGRRLRAAGYTGYAEYNAAYRSISSAVRRGSSLEDAVEDYLDKNGVGNP